MLVCSTKLLQDAQSYWQFSTQGVCQTYPYCYLKMLPKVQTWQFKGFSCCTLFLLCDPDQGPKHSSVTSVKEVNGINQNKTCNTWEGRNLKKIAKGPWNTKQEKNLTFSWEKGVLFSQKSLFLLFKTGELRWTEMCSLLCVCYMVIFYGAASDGTKSLWGTDSPLNLQKMPILSIMARSCWSAWMHSVNED